MIQFAESFRLHEAMAEFLREEVYRHDGIAFHSKRKDVLPLHAIKDELVAAVLLPEYPLIVVTHDEDVAALCGRRVEISDGRIRSDSRMAATLAPAPASRIG